MELKAQMGPCMHFRWSRQCDNAPQGYIHTPYHYVLHMLQILYISCITSEEGALNEACVYYIRQFITLNVNAPNTKEETFH